MATVTEILDRAALLSGQQTTGVERTLALQALNNVYQDVNLEVGCVQTTATHTISTSSNEYDISALITADDVLRLRHIFFSGGGNTYPLKHVTEGQTLDQRHESVTGGRIQTYSMLGQNQIRFWPKPGVGDVLTFTYVKELPELVESGATGTQTTTPSEYKNVFHWNVLLPGIMVEIFDNDARAEDVQFWGQRYESGIAKMKVWRQRMGGDPPGLYLEPDSFWYWDKDRHIRPGN